MARSRKRSKPIPYLPEEIIFKILSWTNATSLLKFQSVCKLWRSIILDNKFMESHHTNSLKNPSILLITNVVKKSDHYYNSCAASVLYSNSPKDSVDLRLPSPLDNMEIVSSCNGIVCVRDFSGDDIYLLNPLTMMSKRLPRIFFSLEQGRRNNVDVAFGFDCVSHDFKVLKITYEKDEKENSFKYRFFPKRIVKVQLYSSNANTWRPVVINTILSKFRSWSLVNPVLISGPVINGVLYLADRYVIVTFDLHNEIFGLVEFPDFMQGRSVWNNFSVLAILDFEGHVAMIYKSDNGDISLWIMEEVSGKVFWNKTLTFDASSKMDWVYLYLGAEEFVGETKLGEIILYNYRNKETKCIGLDSHQSLKRVIRHTESLLPIK